jgi:CRP/FNR family transcriptional regulator
VRALASGEILFRAGNSKTHVFRVETGTICIYEPQWSGQHSAIEFAFAGDLVGLGDLERYTRTACALAEAQVKCLPLSALDVIVEGDPRARGTLKQAVERELEFVRTTLVSSGDGDPVGRLAALLTFIAHTNRNEGRDPSTIADSVTCDVVAGYLGLSIDLPSQALLELAKRNLIELCGPSGLRIKDLTALDRLARGNAQPFSAGRTAEKFRRK